MLNDETQEVDLETSTEETEEDTEVEVVEEEEEKGIEYWKAEALKNKAILERNKTKKVERTEESDNFGYDVKAYLKASGINADEFDFVKAEMKASGKDVDSLLESKYFQEALETRRALDKTDKATIKGKRSGGVATDSVEYWAAKPFEDVPKEMRGKVLAHREAKEKNKEGFYNS